MKTIASVVCLVVLAGGIAAVQARSAAPSKPVTVEIKDARVKTWEPRCSAKLRMA
jgi:hypothetical protein